MRNVRLRLSMWTGVLLLICCSVPALAQEKEKETLFTGESCPGFRFIGGVVTSDPDVDVSDICNFLGQGGGITGPGFGLPGGPDNGDPAGACGQEGGIWDGHNCAHPGSVKYCRLTGGQWINSKCVYRSNCQICALTRGPWDGFVVRYKGNNVLVLTKRGCIQPKVKSIPVEVHLRESGLRPYTNEKKPTKQ